MDGVRKGTRHSRGRAVAATPAPARPMAEEPQRGAAASSGGEPPGAARRTAPERAWLEMLTTAPNKRSPSPLADAQALVESLLVDPAFLPRALAHAANARTARSPTELLANAVHLLLNAPNAFAHTAWAPVKATGDARDIAHYVGRGLLRRDSAGLLYARVRDPSGDGNAPTHNRALGDGDVMLKGCGVCTAQTFALAGGGRIKSAVYYDATAKGPMHRFKGALTAAQAASLESPAFKKLSARFRENLAHGPAGLRALAHKHHVDEAAIPSRLLTLELLALPVQVLDDDARRALATSGARVRVAREVSPNDDVVWLKPDALQRLAFRGAPPPAPEQLVVHLYTAHNPALRAESLARPMAGNMLAERAFPCAPPLVWDRPLDVADAAVCIGYWQPFFAAYGWALEHVADRTLRVVSQATQTPLVVGGDARAGSLRAAELLHEGAAVLNGMLLRALWQEDLSVTAHAGGTPFQGRNANPRARLDWDTLGPAGGPRDLGDGEIAPRTRRATRKYELAYTTDPTRMQLSSLKEGSPIRQCTALWRALGLSLGPESLVAERRAPFLMMRLATHGDTTRYTAGADALAVPTALARVLAGRTPPGGQGT